jgi:hypothetical protein
MTARAEKFLVKLPKFFTLKLPQEALATFAASRESAQGIGRSRTTRVRCRGVSRSRFVYNQIALPASTEAGISLGDAPLPGCLCTDVRTAADRLGHAIGSGLSNYAGGIAASAADPAAQRRALRAAATVAHSACVPAVRHFSRPSQRRADARPDLSGWCVPQHDILAALARGDRSKGRIGNVTREENERLEVYYRHYCRSSTALASILSIATCQTALFLEDQAGVVGLGKME